MGCFGWVGHYFGLVGVNGVYGTLFWVGGGQWGWVGVSALCPTMHNALQQAFSDK